MSVSNKLIVSGAIGLLVAFFAGLFVAMAGPESWLKPVERLLCKEGETLVREYYRGTYHRPGEQGVRFAVKNAAGETVREPGLVVFLYMALVLWPACALIVSMFMMMTGRRSGQREPAADMLKQINAQLGKEGIIVEGVSDSTDIKIGDLGELIKNATRTSVSSNADVVAASLEKLQELVDKGLISREDYEAKKADLLKRL
jgi:hypothetical protein